MDVGNLGILLQIHAARSVIGIVKWLQRWTLCAHLAPNLACASMFHITEMFTVLISLTELAKDKHSLWTSRMEESQWRLQLIEGDPVGDPGGLQGLAAELEARGLL